MRALFLSHGRLMPTRVIVIHDEPAFRDALAAALRDAGYEVVAIDDPAFVVSPPRGANQLEITISHGKGAFPGLRIRVTGFLTGEPYAGPLGQFLGEPVKVADVVRALRPFEGDFGGMKL
jgi:hypothetical protein